MRAGKTMILAVLVCLSSADARAQEASPDERKAVLATVDSFFAAMTRRDTVASRAVMLPGSAFHYILPGREPRTTPDTAYFRSLATAGPKLQERIWNPRVEIHGPIAEVWTRYDFHVGGQFSHCGIDDFSLIKGPGGWRIATATYTIEREGCPESPLGPLPAQ